MNLSRRIIVKPLNHPEVQFPIQGKEDYEVKFVPHRVFIKLVFTFKKNIYIYTKLWIAEERELDGFLHPDHAYMANSRRGSSQSEQLDVEPYQLNKDFSRSLPGSRRSSFQAIQNTEKGQVLVFILSLIYNVLLQSLQNPN